MWPPNEGERLSGVSSTTNTDKENISPSKASNITTDKHSNKETINPADVLTSNTTTVSEDDAFLSSIHSFKADPNESITTVAKLAPNEQAETIQKQIAFYFSEENLSRDMHMYGKVKGLKNRPVQIKHLQTFPRMSRYEFDAIIDALQTSAVVDLVEIDGIYHAKRKVPFSKTEYDSRPGRPDQTRRQPPAGKKPKPTGFEDGYTEAPITPAEFEENEELYSDDLSFADRIETAIQKYKARRKFSNELSDVWVKWMKFGGIQTGQKQFSGGVIQSELDSKTASEIAKLTATEFCRDAQQDLGPDGEWAVDFEAIAKGFLSSFAREQYEFDTIGKVTRCTKLMRNFYNYLLYHRVCPEYTDQIKAAQRVCNLADEELIKCYNVVSLFPGHFNIACSTKFNTEFARNYCQGQKDWDGAGSLGMLRDQASKIFAFGMSAYGPDEAFVLNDQGGKERPLKQIVLQAEHDGWFQVSSITFSDSKIAEIYEKYNTCDFKPLGKLVCKPWDCHSFSAYDRPKGWQPEHRSESYELLVEDALLKQCFIGMKWQGSIYKMTCGLWFIDDLRQVHPSFFQLLLNELIVNKTSKGKYSPWREPEIITREQDTEHKARDGGQKIESGEQNGAGAGGDADDDDYVLEGLDVGE